ncbi:Branched-chain amino acid transport, AzlD [Klebsiella pneumoniae ISC21]|nr:Branched-chain amino acid transport, AzlD [Klebsiella pneumoniae ISC21]
MLGAAFWKTRSIIVPTLLSAFCLWSGMENHQRALSFTYQSWSIIHLIYLSQ